jgi:hypothetical protein
MHQVREAISLKEKQVVIKAMREYGNIGAEKVWGFWDGDTCIGGSNLYNTSQLNQENFSIGINLNPNFNTGFVIYSLVGVALTVVPRLIAKIKITNVQSRKGAKQVGFRKIYSDSECEYLELQQLSPKMYARWGKVCIA